MMSSGNDSRRGRRRVRNRSGRVCAFDAARYSPYHFARSPPAWEGLPEDFFTGAAFLTTLVLAGAAFLTGAVFFAGAAFFFAGAGFAPKRPFFAGAAFFAGAGAAFLKSALTWRAAMMLGL